MPALVTIILLSEDNKNFIDNLFRSHRLLRKLDAIVTAVLKPKARLQAKRLTCDEVVEIFWCLKVYPYLITKKKLKFFYMYSLIENNSGLSVEETAKVLIYAYLQ